jgi:hypothetical protein
MTEAWFSPDTARLFSFLSFLSLCSLFAGPARRGLYRGLATAVWNTVTAFALLLVTASAVALTTGQPWYVSRTLLSSGVVLGAVFAFTRRGLMRCYREAELRRTVAADL